MSGTGLSHLPSCVQGESEIGCKQGVELREDGADALHGGCGQRSAPHLLQNEEDIIHQGRGQSITGEFINADGLGNIVLKVVFLLHSQELVRGLPLLTNFSQALPIGAAVCLLSLYIAPLNCQDAWRARIYCIMVS